MHLYPLLLLLGLGAFEKCAAADHWCYIDCVHSPSYWEQLPGSFCGGKKQSPIDIETNHAEINDSLVNFNFTNLNSKHAIKSMNNTGHTVKFELEHDVEIRGGGLNGTYTAIQFHFHWGDGDHHPGSEHMLDGHRFPMEMHIVSRKKNLTIEEAKKDPEGIAVLGFLINGTEDGNVTDMDPWEKLTSYLNVKEKKFDESHSFSISDLIANVDLTKFYRYSGSLTTPDCNEVVVWTVFKEPININKSLIERFPREAGYSNSYRPKQDLNGRKVFASPALHPKHPWCYDSHCDYMPDHWVHLPNSHCGGDSQSPINIETNNTKIDERLGAFIFSKFDDKHAIKSITNTGHAVKCVLKEGLVEVSGGGLAHTYSTLQFHFHWGSADSDGSEHIVDKHRYPMEMHIVNKRKDLSLEDALKTSDGLAVLGFFIEAKHTTKSSSSSSSDHAEPDTPSNPTPDTSDAWNILTKYLSKIHNISSEAELTEAISIDDLLGDVNRAEYYRYSGSLTTPSCNEAVVWTVFKDSVKVDKNLMMMFPKQMGYHDVFRPEQKLNHRTVYTTSASCVLTPITLFMLLSCFCGFFI